MKEDVKINEKRNIPWNKGKKCPKTSKTLKEGYKKGRVVWNKGLTKETNKIVAQIALKRVGVKRPDQSERMKGKNNPTKRPEVKEKLKKNHWTKNGKWSKNHWTKNGKWSKEEIFEKMSTWQKNKSYEEKFGKGRAIEMKENLSKTMKGRKGRKHSKESIIKISKATQGNKNPNYGGKCYARKRIKYKNIMFRSSWEVIIAKWLDKNKYVWKYEPKRFYFKDCTYLPDFYVEELDSYIEVKGWWDEISIKKIKLFQKYHPDKKLIIIDKSNINEYK